MLNEDVTCKFLRYIAVDTASDETTGTSPSTAGQFDLAKLLISELKEIGIPGEDIFFDSDHCYIYCRIKASSGIDVNTPKIGFIAHMDTSPDFCGENVSPRIIENYDGEDVELGEGRILKRSDFPHLAELKGRTLIVTDGKTLLGADDKAGIAEIMTLAETLIEKDLPHGKICIAFTPDEEIGEGADHFDVARFGADFAYTADGDVEGGIEYENFNAAGATFEINGFNIHPGSAKDKMINASLIAMEINSLLPADEIPSKTEGYEGFFHLTDMSGNVERSELDYIVRDHDENMFEARKTILCHIEKTINEKYGEGTVELTIREQYRNMKEQILPCMHLVDTAVEAAKRCGVKATIEAIRGGTDGARLSFMGLPCPNLGTAGYAFHGPYEHITVEGMQKQVEILTEIVKMYAQK